MILGRNHLILLFDTESQNSSKQIWSVLVGTNYLSFHIFFKKHFLKDFLFWWYVIQQPFTEIFYHLHTFSKDIFYILLNFRRDI